VPSPTISHPRRAWAALGLVILLVLAGCGDDDSAAPSAPREPRAGEAGAFPVVVEHEHGSTEVTEAPERVVTVGYSDQDYVLALGVRPVAVTDWYGEKEFATWEWAQDELGDAKPVVLNQGTFTGTADYQYEQIAGLRPDLIIGLYTDMNEQQYGLLSQIAPTIAPSGDYPEFGMPWQESTRMVGAALGRPARAEELIADVDDLFAEARSSHPAFGGVEIVVGEQFDAGKSFVRSATDPRTVFMTSLGFVLPADIAALAGDKDGADVSDEQMELLDRGLLVWNVGHDPTLRAQIEAKPLYPTLDVVKAGHSIFIDDPLVSGALTWATVLSLPYAIAELVPVLADAVT
jgi:iron complex transport system substrate-binding protein